MLYTTDSRWLLNKGGFTKLLLLPAMLISSLLLTGFAASNRPEQLAIDFLTAAEINDVLSVATVFCPMESAEDMNILYTIATRTYEELQEHEGIKNPKIDKVEYSDKTHAQVDLIIEYNDNDKAPMKLKILTNEEGNWCINTVFFHFTTPPGHW